MVSVANVVSVGRVVLALSTVSLLWLPSDKWRWLAFFLTALVIYGDALDGYLARKLKQASKFGGMIDIASDRIVEMAYWIAFSALGWIAVWIPLLFLVRGSFVDTIRAIASEKGFTAFGEKTMMHSKIGKFLVASNFSRFSYACAKAFAFCLLIVAHTSQCEGTVVTALAWFFVYFSCLFCLIRGIPVLMEAGQVIEE